jgi:hypothetical protein
MSTTASQQLVENYLNGLRGASRELPREERGELRAQIEEHLRDALPTDPSEAMTRTVLERLGDPTELVAEHLDRLGLRARRVGTQEWAAIILLLIGGFIFFVGWIVGAVLLWTSRAWTAREKLVGTLVVPGGLAVGLWLGLFVGSSTIQCGSSGGPSRPTITRCTPGPSTLHQVLVAALVVALIIAPIATAIFLARRARAVPA